MRKGWFIIPGVQDGDRTVEEQAEALRPAMAEAAGKTVLDLGCAEGLLTREFIYAGAKMAFGVDSVPAHLDVAREVCKGMPVQFAQCLLGTVALRTPAPSFDIVMALGVVHKLPFPDVGVRIAAQLSHDLVLLRSGLRQRNGIITAKQHPQNTCDSHALMREHGFELEKVVQGPGPHFESVEYWRKA